MNYKIINYLITALAIIGFIIILGAIGASDFSIDVPMKKTIEMLILGSSLTAPALMRGVLK